MSFTSLPCQIIAFIVMNCAAARADDGHQLPAGPTAPAAKVTVAGAALEFTPTEVPKRRSVRNGLEVIEKARARLTVDKPLLVRRSRLPAGEYEIRIEQDADKAYFLVVDGGADAPSEPNGDDPKRGEAGPQPKRPRASKGSDKGAALETKEERKAPETKPQAKEKAISTPATSLRVPLKVASCERKGDQLAFEMATRAKGTKLRITVRAGETQATAALRFGEP